MQSGSIQCRVIPCFGLSNLTLSTVNMSVTCSDSSTHVCHSAIVTDSTLLSVRYIAIVTSHSNPSVCPSAIVMCAIVTWQTLCNDSNSSAQVCDGNSEIGLIPSHYRPINGNWAAASCQVWVLFCETDYFFYLFPSLFLNHVYLSLLFFIAL